jgi:very-short-patch-repair endonuclease
MSTAPRPPRSEGDVPDEISPERHTRPSDRVIERFAEGQHGVLTLAQLRELGLGERGIEHRAAVGRLRRLHRGIYAVERPRAEGAWTAAVLACGTDAALSHTSAAALWGVGAEQGAVHVTVSRGQRRPRPGLVVHRAKLTPEDVTTLEGIPCTTLPRTLVDLAALVEPRRLERAVDRAEELRVFDLGAVRAQLQRMRGCRGSAALGGVLASFGADEGTRSAAEERFLALVRRSDLPMPEVNVWVPLPEGGGYRPDFLWRRWRLIVEVDGRTYHARRAAFEWDRRRDRRLAVLGYETRRYAARELSARPAVVVAELRCFLSNGSQRDRA